MLVAISQPHTKGGDDAMATKKRPGRNVTVYFENPDVLSALDAATEETKRQNQIRNWSRSRQLERMLADQLGIRREIKLYLSPLKPQSKKPQ